LDEKIHNHAFGLYANWTPLEGFGISAGYSGLLQSWENPKNTTTNPPPYAMDDHRLSLYEKVVFPFYSGVDLRLNYTGVDKLSITFNNNVSFASVAGTAQADEIAKKQYSYGWAYRSSINEAGSLVDGSEDYLGLYNALGVKYTVSEALAVDVQAANQLGIFTYNGKGNGVSLTTKATTNYLGGYGGVTYTIVRPNGVKGSIRCGVAVKWSSYSYQDPTVGTLEKPVYEAGYVDFGIPVGLKIEF
jgi:hypothetical protein